VSTNQPDGQSFLIKNAHLFAEVVLPKFWKHNNLQSFIRQLNMYSFQKTRHDSNYREFRQPNFQKGRRDLLVLIKRKTQGKHDQGGGSGRGGKGRLDDEDGDVDDGDDDNYGDDDDGVAEKGAGVKDGRLPPFASIMSELKGERQAVSSEDFDALRHYVVQLEQQVWMLTSKYAQLEERLAQVEQQNRSVDGHHHHHHRGGGAVPEEQPASAASVSSSSGGSIVRMISIDPTSGLGRKTDPQHHHASSDGHGGAGVNAFSSVSVSVSISQNKRTDCGGLPSEVACKTPKCDHATGGAGAGAAACRQSRRRRVCWTHTSASTRPRIDQTC
jgi:hypothetical protein